ncbi:MAG: hypothetical protein KDA51_01890, partial [Planctomycetales bacterium]|nr:hypothetical protein [Planctomycetales bacterium]
MLCKVVMSMTLFACLSGAALAKGPAEKVTGSFQVVVGYGTFDADIEAHEAHGNRPAKGSFNWSGVRNGVRYYITGSVT